MTVVIPLISCRIAVNDALKKYASLYLSTISDIREYVHHQTVMEYPTMTGPRDKHIPTSNNTNTRETSISRRTVLAAAIAAPFAIQVKTGIAQSDTKRRSGRLVRPVNVNQLKTKSKVKLELDGELHLKQSSPTKGEGLLTVKARGKSVLEYREDIAFDDNAVIGSAREYIDANTENWIDGKTQTQEIRPECMSTIQLKRNGVWDQYCPEQPLSTREVELLRSPINSAVLELLLPAEPAKAGESWDLPAEDAASLFNLDAVHTSSVTAEIVKVENGKATVEFDGSLDATVNAVPTKLTLKGNFQVGLGSQCALITWLGLVIKEDREISNAEPGFLITARISLIRAETQVGAIQSADQLRDLATKDDAGRWLVRLTAMQERCSMLADRRWKMYSDGGEEAVIRCIENDMVIAQCNVKRLPDFEEGQQLTIEGLQADIRKSLGEQFETFLTTDERAVSSDVRMVRCIAMGQAEEVPVQWIYAHLSNDAGERVLMLFTMGGNLTDRFAGADEQMAASFELLQPNSDAPTEAPLLSSQPSEDTKR